MKLTGWGKYPVLEAQMHAPRDVDEVIKCVLNTKAIARGNGRAYGDSAVSPTNTLHMKHFNRLLSFDAQSGQLVAEAGVVLGDIIKAFLPRGWFPAVTPGTKFVTLGGMIAADVHGKNHHKDGSFGTFIDWIELVDAQGKIQRCSRTEQTDLFEWTIGGMGLTGVILRAAFRLRPVETSQIKQTTFAAANIDQAIDLFEDAMDATYSVAWIDCLQHGAHLGRSLVMLGEHAKVTDLQYDDRAAPLSLRPARAKTLPFNFPTWALNTWSVRAFNALYHWKGKRTLSSQIVDWDKYFYPLDAILGWNKIYGRKGFAQFQCVIPLDQSRDGLRALLKATSRVGAGSFLAVLKRFGPQDSPFSFPMEGFTLALDFPINDRTLRLMKKLDSITLEHGGRFYLAKDSRMTRDVFQQSDPRAADFTQKRKDLDMTTNFASAQSERLGL